MRRGNPAEPRTLDPSLAQGTYEDYIISDLLVGLMTHDARSHAIPGMATRWETSGDGLTWTFHLREAQWSDGEPVTAEDFVFAWRRLLDPKTASEHAYFLHVLKNGRAVNAGRMPLTSLGAEAIDARTIRIELEHPAPYLLEMMTHMHTYPLPRHVVRAKGDAWARPGNFISNGPFILKEWIPNDRVTVAKNPRFYDAARVGLQSVIFYPTEDYGAGLRRVRAGELDVQQRAPGEQMSWLRKNMPESISQSPKMTLEFTAVNTKREPFGDVRVRAAMNMTINREIITGKITGLNEPPAYHLVPPGTANFPGGNALHFQPWPPERRLEEARRLMRQAGFGPDRRLKTTYALRYTSPGPFRSTAALVQQLMSLIYIDLTILPFDAAIFYRNLDLHDFDLAQAGWAADFNDAETFLSLFETDSGSNWGRYSSLAFDRTLGEARRMTDLETRGRKLAEAEAILLQDHAFLPIFFWANSALVRPYVKGWIPNPMDYNRSRWITIDENERRATLARIES